MGWSGGEEVENCFVGLYAGCASRDGAASLLSGATTPGASWVRVLVGGTSFFVSLGHLTPHCPDAAPVVMAPHSFGLGLRFAKKIAKSEAPLLALCGASVVGAAPKPRQRPPRRRCHGGQFGGAVCAGAAKCICDAGIYYVIKDHKRNLKKI